MNIKTRKTDRYPPATWLRKLTSPYVCGEKVASQVYPLQNKDQLARSYNHWGFVPRLTNTQYHHHTERNATYYFQGNSFGTHTLVMIDIDVQKASKLGSTAG